MNNLKKYVDGLFSEYKQSQQIKELKAEILSNLEAKVADLTSNGMEYNQAIKITKENMNSIDHLIDGNKKVYTNRYKVEWLQIALLYALLTWILIMPFRVLGAAILPNFFLFFIVIVLGFLFFIFNRTKETNEWNKTTIYNTGSAKRLKKLAWFIWWIFITISLLSTTAVQFGSNIWFARPVYISGPYQLAVLLMYYILPFFTIPLPLLFNNSLKLIHKHDAGELNEE